MEFGPPRNRGIVALALGFSDDPAALGALLARLDDDRPFVVKNALLGLGVLADPATPVQPILRPLQNSSDEITRNNAMFALLRLIGTEEAAFQGEPTLEALRSALRDPKDGVRAQAAAALQVVGTANELESLNDRIYDPQDLIAAASVRAVGMIGRRDDTVRGRAARIVFEKWRKSSSSLKRAAHLEMVLLADGRDLGEEEEDWRDWAYGLP